MPRQQRRSTKKQPRSETNSSASKRVGSRGPTEGTGRGRRGDQREHDPLGYGEGRGYEHTNGRRR